MIYLDTSAMVKVVVSESESVALIDWLNDHSDVPWSTSVIGRIELVRSANRVGPAAVAAAHRLLQQVDTLVLTDEIVAVTQTLGPPELRTLDAVHLATAHTHRRRLHAICAYDHRLLAAAQAQQLPVATPGR